MNTLDKEELKARLNKYTYKSGDCWRYNTFNLDGSGHALIRVNYKRYLVHRLSAYIFLDFDLESELHILHDPIKCKFTNCWNPEHLRVGTHQDNMRDRLVRTHCKRGHEYTKSNLSYNQYGGRGCKKCKLERQRKRRLKLKNGIR